MIDQNLDMVSIMGTDWSEAAPQQRYDWIISSEVVCHRPTYDALVKFLGQPLQPPGTIVLAKSMSLTASGFFSRLTQHYKFKRLDKVMRSEEQQFAISLYTIKPKEEA